MKPAGEEADQADLPGPEKLFIPDGKKDFVFQNQEGNLSDGSGPDPVFYSDRRQVYLVTENREYAFTESLRYSLRWMHGFREDSPKISGKRRSCGVYWS